ncbi:MAG: tetratricopeptide repeat protein, partial [Anaerolineae bacterium]|nr:tetratricopeptide repeat protein [Anaerolineae bacterium]
ANDFVWAEKWDDAVSAYRQALAEFPDNDSALIGFAWALYNNKDLDEALEVYEHLSELTPADPGPYERRAEILEGKGYPQRAARTYREAAQRYAQQDLTAKRTSALEAAARLYPNDAAVWSDLLEAYQAQDQTHQAVLATLWLAYLYQHDRRDQAIALCRDMQRIIRHDPRIGQMVILLQSGRAIIQPPPIGSEKETVYDVDLIEAESEVEIEFEAGTPVEIARQRALAKLAESIFAEDRSALQSSSPIQVELLIGRAVDAQTRGEIDSAIKDYTGLLAAGVSMPSIHFNLGLLYKERMRFDLAIEQFEASLTDAEYVLGSHYSLGECYQAKGDFQEALKQFLEAVKVVDIATIEREHVDDLIRVYEGLTQSLVNTGEPQQAQQVSQKLVDFLGRRGWEDGAIKARKRLDELARMGTVLSLAELISVPGSEEILRSIALTQEYRRRNRLYSALEEIMHTMSTTPYFLPLHHLLGVVLRDNGDIDEAIAKFETIAKTYEIRGQILQALATYERILEISPLNIAVHRRVLELLIQHGRIDDALQQYLQTADAYYQLAQPDRAREIYNEAFRLAPRGNPEKGWQIRILYRMADLDVQRLDWSEAIKDNEEILRLSPDDERA